MTYHVRQMQFIKRSREKLHLPGGKDRPVKNIITYFKPVT
jgi:hypothetical protein